MRSYSVPYSHQTRLQNSHILVEAMLLILCIYPAGRLLASCRLFLFVTQQAYSRSGSNCHNIAMQNIQRQGSQNAGRRGSGGRPTPQRTSSGRSIRSLNGSNGLTSNPWVPNSNGSNSTANTTRPSRPADDPYVQAPTMAYAKQTRAPATQCPEIQSAPQKPPRKPYKAGQTGKHMDHGLRRGAGFIAAVVSCPFAFIRGCLPGQCCCCDCSCGCGPMGQGLQQAEKCFPRWNNYCMSGRCDDLFDEDPRTQKT